jgi:hypothetical protein
MPPRITNPGAFIEKVSRDASHDHGRADDHRCVHRLRQKGKRTAAPSPDAWRASTPHTAYGNPRWTLRSLLGVKSLEHNLSGIESAPLNARAVNCLRTFPTFR